MSDHALLERLAEAVRSGAAIAVVTVLGGGGARAGTKLLVEEAGGVRGTTGDAALDAEVVALGRAALATGVARRVALGALDLFVQPIAAPPALHVIGAVHPAAALAEAAKLLGYRVIVCDPRSPFATRERLRAADEIVRRWPDEHLAGVELSPRDAVCILTHDVKFDVPALRVALASRAGYVGAMGSRRTHERRLARLREEGVSEADLARVRAPIGLDIGARSPAEIAVAVLAEIVASRYGKSAAAR